MELFIKATKLDATYERDSTYHPDATHFDTVSHDEVLRHGLEIMGSTVIEFWKSHAMAPLLSKT